MARLGKHRALINNALKKEFFKLRKSDTPKVLYQAMYYSVFNGGKRIRPLLCLATYDAVKAQSSKLKAQSYRKILPFACGIELVHTFSLIQDDLPSMDNDDFRRGKPSLHKAYNEAVALLAADALFAMAFELFTKAKVSADIKVRTIFELSRICGIQGLAAGQMMDILGVRHNERELIDEKKTAALISGSMKIGAIVAGASDKIVKKIEKTGIYLGLLFQATDDIIDKCQILNIKNQKLKARQYAHKAKMVFNQLGNSYDIFDDFTEKMLNRTK